MKIIISPAKSLDFDSELNTKNFSNPKFLEKTLAINSILKKKSPSELMKLQSISEKLSELNWKRNLEFSENQNDDNSRPAIFAFNGDVYDGLDVKTLDNKKIKPDTKKELEFLINKGSKSQLLRTVNAVFK